MAALRFCSWQAQVTPAGQHPTSCGHPFQELWGFPNPTHLGSHKFLPHFLLLSLLPPLPLTLKHHCFSLGLYLRPHPMPPSDLPAFPLASHKKPASKISKESNKKSKIAKTKVNKDKVNYKETEIR
jgi:hypothetical protein